VLVLATPNAGAADLIRDGEGGWILPARDAAAFGRQLTWIDSHRTEAAVMLQTPGSLNAQRDWRDAALDFVQHCRQVGIDNKRSA
jgi:hypothetical protein